MAVAKIVFLTSQESIICEECTFAFLTILILPVSHMVYWYFAVLSFGNKQF